VEAVAPLVAAAVVAAPLAAAYRGRRGVVWGASPTEAPSPAPLVNRLDTALHITVLHHGFHVGAISIWGGLARPHGRASKHGQGIGFFRS
jgi:hypothetical protein